MRPVRNRSTLWGATTAAVLVAGTTLVASLVRQTDQPFLATDGQTISVAVLPFQMRGVEQAGDQSVAAGMHELLTHRLQQIGSLRVTWPSSVVEISEAHTRADDIARALGVDYLVGGSLQRDGPRLRVVVNLLGPDADEVRESWVFTWTLAIEDLFAIQAQVATEIAAALAVELTGEERARIADRPTLDEGAWAAFLRGNGPFQNRAFAQARTSAADAYREARRLDSAFTDAHARLARVRALDFWFGAYDRRALADAQAALARAEALDSTRAEVHLARGDLLYYTLRDYAGARRHYERVLELEPSNADAIAQLGLMLARTERWEEVRPLLGRSLELDPRSRLYPIQMRTLEAETRSAERARYWARRALELDPLNDAHRHAILRIELCIPGDTIAAREFLEASDWVDAGARQRARAAVALFRGDVQGALRLWRAIPSSSLGGAVFTPHGFPIPVRERAFALHLDGDTNALRELADSVLAALPDTSATAEIVAGRYRHMTPGFDWSQRGFFEALRGSESAARRWAHRGAWSLSPDEDRIEHAQRRLDLMDTHVILGDFDAALDELEFLLRSPSPVGLGCLRLHPFYEGLRAYPRFAEIVAGAYTG